ncbi:MAG: selenide, water dikinase SelD [Oscillibacter sp.]|nr:selenide, water dikinase SelD [Oscillibacter sp.]
MENGIRLTHLAPAGGCAAKVGPGVLAEILKDLPNVRTDKLLVGYDSSDDACVYRISDELAAIHTVDFFTPVVDDPYQFGQIAAANALSDVYAMGGTPAVAMNLLCVANNLPKDVIRRILEGGHDKAVEAGCVIAGGHTIMDKEPKYGLCVTGYAHPDRILRNVGAREGDVLVLTKPIGTGVITTGAKVDLAEKEDFDAMFANAVTLNAGASKAALACGDVHACTDVTGFGLIGHGCEMAVGSGVTIEITAADVPLLHGARELAETGIIPAGAYRNYEFAKPRLRVAEEVPQALVDLICDPQTSGGLLIAVSEAAAPRLLENLNGASPCAAVIGRVRAFDGCSLAVV